jgi:hypothetical protein
VTKTDADRRKALKEKRWQKWRACEWSFLILCREVLRRNVLAPGYKTAVINREASEVEDLYEFAALSGRLSTFDLAWDDVTSGRDQR